MKAFLKAGILSEDGVERNTVVLAHLCATSPSTSAAADNASLGGTIGAGMAYDRELAARVREMVTDEAGVTEKKMFGGLAFLIGGNMAVSASGQGGLMVRVDPAESAMLVSRTPARPMEMRGREMPGWLRVDAAAVQSDRALSGWVKRGVAYARSLPAKDR